MKSIESAVGMALVVGVLLSCGILAYTTGEQVTPEMLDRWVNGALIVGAVFAISIVMSATFLMISRWQVQERAYDVQEVNAAATMARLASQQGRLLQNALVGQRAPGSQTYVLGPSELPPPASGHVLLGGGDLGEPPDGRDEDTWGY